jgi:hypothetical protein
MFWEQTPASTITLQPASLPTSIQHFATSNSRWLQKILWAFPKVQYVLISALIHSTHRLVTHRFALSTVLFLFFSFQILAFVIVTGESVTLLVTWSMCCESLVSANSHVN